MDVYAVKSTVPHSLPDDPALDFCLWPYARPRSIVTGDLRSSALLLESIACSPCSDRMRRILDALQVCFGTFSIVYGVKWSGFRLSWEFYFYDYNRQQRRRGMQDFVFAVQDILDIMVSPDDTKPYFMFSVELGECHLVKQRSVDSIDMYIGVPDSGISAGLCYRLSASGLELRNLYYFFDRETQACAAATKLVETARFDGRVIPIEDLLWPELGGSQTIVVANKRHSDGLYFSRIDSATLCWFMERIGYPEPLVQFVRRHQGQLSHHLFDVGFDFEVEGHDIHISKGSFYGIL